MKLTELILQLHTEMLQRGNVDVWVKADGATPPELMWIEATGPYPTGLYLS